MVIGIASVAVFSRVDTWFVSRLGGDELAALGFAFPVMMIVGSAAGGLGIGATSVVSRAIGAGDRAEVRRLTTDALLLAVVVVAALSALGLVYLDPLFRLLGAKGDALGWRAVASSRCGRAQPGPNAGAGRPPRRRRLG